MPTYEGFAWCLVLTGAESWHPLGLMAILKRTRAKAIVDAVRLLATDNKRFDSFDDLREALASLLTEDETDAVAMVRERRS